MITSKHALAAAVAFAAMTLAAPMPAQATEVTGKELSSILPGKTIVGSNNKCKVITYALAPISAGEKRGKNSIDCDTIKDNGEWWVEDDRFCIQFVAMAGGNSFCFDVKKEDGGELAFYRADGSKTKMQLKK